MKGLAAGQLFGGRFRLLRRIGAGGLAEVFEADDEASGQRVALKVLHRHLARDAQLCERFRRELRATRALTAPGIVRVYDLHEDQGRPAFSMELLAGETLAERLLRGSLPVEEGLRLGIELCSALAAAHEAGVVHRDVKPQNVFLCRGGAVKLLDFGLSRVAGQARLTAQSVVMGTPGFVAPELLEGLPSDGRSDLWSLGATLFEALSGRRAYPARDPFKALAAQRGPPPSPQAQNPEVPEAVDLAIRRALEPDPDRRFLDAGQFARALSGLPVEQGAAGPPVLTAGTLEVRALDFSGQTGPGGWKQFLHLLAAALRGSRPIKLAGVLGAPDPRGLARRISSGGAVAVGLSERSAAEVAARCHAEGFATLVVPEQPERGLLPALAGRLRWTTGRIHAAGLVAGAAITAAVGAGLWALFARMTKLTYWGLAADRDLREGALTLAVALGLMIALFPALEVWRRLSVLAFPPLRATAQGDPAVAALAARIDRGLGMLRARVAAAPGHLKLLLDELGHAAEAAVAEGRVVAERVAQLPDPLAPPDEVATAPSGLPRRPDEERDSGMQRLLRLAAALEDAAQAARDPGPPEPAPEAGATPVDGAARVRRAADPASAREELRRVRSALSGGARSRDRER